MAINQAQCQNPAESLDEAWEPVLFNQFHDIICGSHLDEIYEHSLNRYYGAANTVNLATERALDALTAQIDTRGEGLPLVVFNPLAHERSDVVRCTVGLADEKWEWLALTDDQGSEIPLQIDEVHRYPDGTIKRANLIFIARVPSLGWRTYHLHGSAERRYQTGLRTNSFA